MKGCGWNYQKESESWRDRICERPHRMDCWTSPTSLGDWDENVHKLSPQSSHLFTFLVTGPLLSGTLINYQWTIVVTFLLEAFSTTSTMVNCQWFANTVFVVLLLLLLCQFVFRSSEWRWRQRRQPLLPTLNRRSSSVPSCLDVSAYPFFTNGCTWY